VDAHLKQSGMSAEFARLHMGFAEQSSPDAASARVLVHDHTLYPDRSVATIEYDTKADRCSRKARDEYVAVRIRQGLAGDWSSILPGIEPSGDNIRMGQKPRDLWL
jgi:hypothetical protein